MGILWVTGNCNGKRFIIFSIANYFIHLGNVKLTVTNGSHVCGDCIEFSCVANDTNSASILQNGTLCQVFERSGPTASNNCTELSITSYEIQRDQKDSRLSDFVVHGRKCYQGEINEIEIKCVDASFTTKTLSLQVNSKLNYF